MLQAVGNPNLRPNSDVVVPYLVADDITGRPMDRFIVDFRSMSSAEAASYEAPFAYIAPVRQHRAAMSQPEALETWWMHWRSRPEMREALATLPRFVCTPRVAKHRVFVWARPPMLADNAVVVFARSDDTFFGILHSAIHAVWSLRMGTALEDRPRYTSTTSFQTFPFPSGLAPNVAAADYAQDSRAVRIAESAKRLNQLRENWLNPPELVNWVPDVVPGFPDRIVPKSDSAERELRKRTLTRLYNARPQWLVNTHAELDEAVAAAYGLPWPLSAQETLDRLFELNQSRVATSKSPMVVMEEP